ncbi:MAG: hypothetical protein GX616_17175 [Planctomycetes bacterium]|nr:hypothetical protein [Planctomycetota bacterium]
MTISVRPRTHIDALEADEKDLPLIRDLIARFDAGSPKLPPGQTVTSRPTTPAAVRPAVAAAPSASKPTQPKPAAPAAQPGVMLVEAPRAPAPSPLATQPTTITPVPEDPLVIKVFKLRHVDPKSVITAIVTALGDQVVRVTAGPGNSIVVASRQTSVTAIEQLLERLDAAPDESGETNTVITSLKKARASELAPIVQKVVPSLRECIAWQPGNSLLLTGSTASIETARALIATLDAASVETPPPQPVPLPPRGHLPPQPPKDLTTRVFSLKYAQPNSTIVNALRTVAGSESSIFADERTRFVIVSARPAGLDAVEGLLAEIDRPATQPETAPVRLRIRFLWLVSGLPEDKSSAPPADLLPLVEDLQRIGVSGLRLATQNVVEATPGRRFAVRASPVLANRCDLEIEGRFLDETGSQPCLELEARAVEYAPYLEPEKNGYKVFEKRELCTLETTIVTPLGKAIIAGVTPVDRMTSVFIVQVLPQ